MEFLPWESSVLGISATGAAARQLVPLPLPELIQLLPVLVLQQKLA